MGGSTRARKSVPSSTRNSLLDVSEDGERFGVGEIVLAYDEARNCWRRAVVIAVDKPVVPSLRSTTENDTEKEAYIHWKGQDRRLDGWIKWSLIRKFTDDEDIQIVQDDEASDESHAGMDSEYLKEHQEHTKFKTINQIQMGNFVVDAWYFSPYPLEVQNCRLLYICHFCLGFYKFREEYQRHTLRCTARHPPGNEIYRDSERRLAMWEVDGGIARFYCENLCFLSKLFLDHKTLRHPVHLFLFYLLTEMQPDGYHVVGYFSKEKYSRNNVSCILTLPQFQKKGYGKFLINFSYALAITEGRRGTPERPLSDLGKASYLNYWRQILLHECEGQKFMVLADVADKYGFEPNDIIMCLETSGILQADKIPGHPFLYLTSEWVQVLSAKLGKPAPPIKQEKLHWLPYDPFLGPFEYSAEG